jgi:hypothetical protein
MCHHFHVERRCCTFPCSITASERSLFFFHACIHNHRIAYNCARVCIRGTGVDTDLPYAIAGLTLVSHENACEMHVGLAVIVVPGWHGDESVQALMCGSCAETAACELR